MGEALRDHSRVADRIMDKHVQRQIAAVARAHDVRVVYVFGSRADEIAAAVAGKHSESSHPRSDVDIGVQPRRGTRLSAEQRIELALAFEDLLNVTRVDLVVLPEANALLAAEIVRGQLICCADLDEEAELQLYCLRRAGDLAPFYREQWNDLVGVDL